LIRACAWSPDGSRLLSAGRGNLKIWDASSGAELVRFEGVGWVEGCAWSPDGRRVLSVGANNLRLWDASTGAEITRIAMGRDWHAVFRGPDHTLVDTGGEAWRWLIVRRPNPDTGELEVLPAESLVSLPRSRDDKVHPAGDAGISKIDTQT
jgi:WD40 repeat protein